MPDGTRTVEGVLHFLTPQQMAEEIVRLDALINTPHTADYMEAVRLEAAHQQERWGSEHDAGKAPQDWFWLLGYLSGKALAAFLAGNREKGLHHIISSAAALLNWHRAATGQMTAMRPGIVPPADGVQVSSAAQGEDHGTSLDSSDRAPARSEGLLLDVQPGLPASEPPDARGEVRPEGRALVHQLEGHALDGIAATAHTVAHATDGVLASDETNGKRSTSAATASGHELPDGTGATAPSLPVANGGDARVASAGRPSGVPGTPGGQLDA